MKKHLLFLLIILSLLVFCACGDSFYEIKEKDKTETEWDTSGNTEYVVNISSATYHLPSCYIVKNIKEENKVTTTDIDFLVERQYTPCKKCIDK